MISSRLCLRTVAVTLIVNAFLVIVFNIVLLNRRKPAVNERYVTLRGDPFIDDQQLDIDQDNLDVTTANNNLAKNDNCQPIQSTFKRRKLDPHAGMWDKSHVFKTFPFVIKADKWADFSSWNICLSTQCSADLLFWVIEQLKTWKGPMSVSVFVPDVDYTIAVLMIEYMTVCFAEVRERVSFHMVYPDVMPPKLIDTKMLEYDCKRPEDVNIELTRLIRTKQIIKTISIARYPQNLMRNTARQGCLGTYCFTPDIDMLSIPSFSKQINNFVTQSEVEKCKKCAYVVPTYEISVNAQTNPTTKKELLSYITRRLAQRFHLRVFANNQANSNLEDWETMTPGNSIDVAYNVTTWKSHWEPIYITKANVPLFDERFIGYGFTRNSQVYEMRVAGYSWYVLDNAFLTHRGFQTKRSHNKIRRRQIAENNGRYNIFVRELYLRYGVTMDDEDGKQAHKQVVKSRSKSRTVRKKINVDDVSN